MAEEQGQAPPATPPAGAAPAAAAVPPAADAQDVSSLPEWAQKTIREIRDDAAKQRVKATDRDALAAKLKGIEDAQLSEQDKLTRRATELEQKANQTTEELRQERAHREVERQARRLNLVDEETALALVAGRIEYDADGKPTNVEALLKQLAADKPFLVGTDQAAAQPSPRPAASAANPNRGATASGTFTTSQIANRQFYEANRDAIMQANREGRIIEG